MSYILEEYRIKIEISMKSGRDLKVLLKFETSLELKNSFTHLLGERWVFSSDREKIDWLLNGVPNIDFLGTDE